MRSVLVTRPQPAADEFADKLRHQGYKAYVAPMMEYVGVETSLTDLVFFQAIIFTSTQAVEVFARLSPERSLPVLAVGDTTAAAAVKAGFTQVRSAKGNSKDVAALIKTEAVKSHIKKILHLCSADTPDDIAAAVAAAGVEVVNRPIYKAQMVDSIPDDVITAMQKGGIDVVLLFSARTAENFVRLLEQRGLRDITPKMVAVCISEPVAHALRQQTWRGLHVARQPKMEAVMQALKDYTAAAEERRKHSDRRVKPAYHDSVGHVESEAYTGPERRVMARRAHEKRQRQRIWQEKMKFMNRTMLTFAFMFTAIVLAGVFLMAPEYAHIKGMPQQQGHPRRYERPAAPSDGALGGWINKGIEEFQQTTGTVTDTVGQIASSAADVVLNPGSGDFSQVLSNVAALRQQSDGDTAASQSIDRLRAMLTAPDVRSPEDVGRVVDQARKGDQTLDGMFGSVRKEDVEAAAMLLVLNEFRSDISNNRPYAQDLALLRRFAGGDPRMNRALQRLAPYADSGVMNRQALQTEMQGLAGDIVTAELQGQDVSVQEAARKRLDRLARASQPNDIKGTGTDAVVARAQVMLDKGDVGGAMRELQSLNGASAEAARPWMSNAAEYVDTEHSSDDLTQGMLQQVTGAGSASIQSLVTMIKESLGGASVPYLSPAYAHGGDGGKGTVAPAGSALP